jgi:hypothetical protein
MPVRMRPVCESEWLINMARKDKYDGERHVCRNKGEP